MNRIWFNRIFYLCCLAAIAASIFFLFFLIAVILWNGLQAVSLDFIFTPSSNFGSQGGVLYQILGSLLLIITTALIVCPIALGTALYQSEYIKKPALKKLCSILTYGLNGVPSIIFGLFGLIVFVNFLGMGISWFAGSIILAFMILPTVILATFQSMNSIPQIYRESAESLGLSKWQVNMKVVVPQGIHGMISGLFLGLARAIGETAPIMFIATAFSGATLPGSIFGPVSSLPTHILALSQQATNPQALTNAWGASLMLVVLVSIFSISALMTRIKYTSVTAR